MFFVGLVSWFNGSCLLLFSCVYYVMFSFRLFDSYSLFGCLLSRVPCLQVFCAVVSSLFVRSGACAFVRFVFCFGDFVSFGLCSFSVWVALLE